MKYPGSIPNPEMEDWFSKAALSSGYALMGKGKINPMLGVHKHGPEGKCCKECALMVRRGRYFKCEERGITRGPATDHRANWPACGKFMQRTEEL
jgi:hypothetical protein